ncbi:MAG: hypothetical protein ABEJ79_12315 [Halolamina sp.]
MTTDRLTERADTDGTDRDFAGVVDRSDRPRGGIDAFDALYVRFSLREGAAATVRETIADWVDDDRDDDASTLLPVAGVNLCSVFLDGADNRPALVWYVEVVDREREPWSDPVAAVRRSPVFDAGLADLLAGDPVVRARGASGHLQVVTATHPDRQTWYESTCDRPLVAPVAGDDLPLAIAVVALPLRSRLVSVLSAATVRFVDWLKRSTPLGEALRGETEVLAEERLYSESFVLGPPDDDGVRRMHYYIEAESMDQLYEGFEDADDWTARLGEALIRRVFASPERLLDPPLESDYELLVHAVDPGRG